MTSDEAPPPKSQPLTRESAPALLLHGHESFRETLQRNLAPPGARVLLTGPLGTGRFHMAVDAIRRIIGTGGTCVRVESAGRRTAAELLDSLVEASAIPAEGAEDMATLEARLVRRLQTRDRAWLVLRNLDDLDDDALAWFRRLAERLPDVRFVVTAVLAPELPSFEVVHVPLLVEDREADQEAAERIFADALPAGVALPERGLSESQRRGLIRLCAGRAMFIRRAAARTRLLPLDALLDTLETSDAGAPAPASAQTWFGRTIEELAESTVRLLPDAAAHALELALRMPDAFSPDELASLSDTVVREVERSVCSPKRDAALAALHVARAHLVRSIDLLTELGMLQEIRWGERAVLAVPRPLERALRDALDASERAASAPSLLDYAARVWLNRWIALALDRLHARQAPETFAELVARRNAVVRRAVGPESERHPADRPADAVRALALAACLIRRSGLDARATRDVFDQMVHWSRREERTPDGDRVLGRALVEVYFLLRTRGSAHERNRIAERMQEVLDSLGPGPDDFDETRCYCHYYRAVHAMSEGATAPALDHATRASELAERIGRVDLAARVATVSSFLHIDTGSPFAAALELERHVRTLRAGPPSLELGTLLSNLTSIHVQCGAPLRATSTAREALTWAEAYGDTYLQMRTHAILARLLDQTTGGDDARHHHAALELAQRLQSTQALADAEVRAAWHDLLFAKASADDAIARIEAAVVRARSAAIPRMVAYTEQSLVEALLFCERFDEALALVQRTLERVSDGRPVHRVELLALQAASRPLDPAARSLLDEAEALLGEREAPNARALLTIQRIFLETWIRPETGDDPGGAPDPLVALLRPRTDAADLGERPIPIWQTAFMLRVALRCATQRLPVERRNAAWSAAFNPDGVALLVLDQGAELQLPGGTWLSLRSTPVLASIVRALAVQARVARAESVPLPELLEAAWPGERGDLDARTNRIHQALSRLRRMGLRGLLESHAGGYRFAPSADVIAPLAP